MASADAEVAIEKEDTSISEDKSVTEDTSVTEDANVTQDPNVTQDTSITENTETDDKTNGVDKDADAETKMETENETLFSSPVNACQLRFHPLDCKELLSAAFMDKIQKLEGYWHCRLMKRLNSDDFDIDFSFTNLSERNEIMDFLETIPSDDASKEEGFEHLWTTPDVYGETRATEDNTLIVHNVPKDTTEEELKEIYPNAHIKARTKMAPRSDPDETGYAILIFNSKEEAEETLKKKVTIKDTVLSYARVNELAKSRLAGQKPNKNQEKRGQQRGRGNRGNMGGNRGRGGASPGNRGGGQMTRGGRQTNRGGGQMNRGGRDGGMMGRGGGGQMGNRNFQGGANESQMDNMMAVQRQLQMQLMQMKGQMQEEMMAQMDLQRNMMQGGTRQAGNKRRYDNRF